jgi:hypothetical protein
MDKKWAAIYAILISVGSMVYMGCNKAIELDNKLDQREAISDSLFKNDSLTFAYIKDINRKIGIKNKMYLASSKGKRKGLIWKGLDLLFARGK